MKTFETTYMRQLSLKLTKKFHLKQKNKMVIK